MKNSGIAYLLALLGFLTPLAGVHRFYLGRPISGFFYLITWGFLGIGTLIDLFLIPGIVDDENRRMLYPGAVVPALPAPPSLEQQILRAARENGGVITVELAALQTSTSLADARYELERLRKEGFCSVDVSTEGAKLYIFEGLRSTTPLEIV
jgi:TM2 domain-containing membrane protein YozV